MAVAYYDIKGQVQQVPADKLQGIYAEAKQAGTTVPALLNRKFSDFDPKLGTAAQQLFTSAGLILPDAKDPMQVRPGSVADILEGRTEMAAGPANTKDNASPFGSASRILFPAAVIAAVEANIAKDRVTDTVTFDQMIGARLNITNDTFEQPVINYSGQGGPESAKAQRVAQLANPPMMLKITTSDRVRRLAAHGIGMEISEQALRATTLDLVVMTMTRFLDVERDDRVYRYISDLYSGNNDLVVGAVSSVTSTSLNGSATAGVLTHKAWVKWLARSRKYRRITHVICDIDTYLKIEGRTGRPGTNSYDPTLARIDPQVRPMNVGFGNDVQFMIVDSATDGGPVPANTIYGLDASQAVAMVTNTAAAYSATEDYVMRRSQALRLDWSEDVYRLWGDAELRAFDVLVID